MSAIFTLSEGETVRSYVSRLIGVQEEQIVGEDLSLVDSRPATVFSDFILSPRLDNLGSAYASLQAFAVAPARGTVNVCAAFDAEEVGSLTRTGAGSGLLGDLLKRICGQSGADWISFKERSLLISADAGFSPHPNYAQKTEVYHPAPFGCGIGLKEAVNGGMAFDLSGLCLVAEAAKRSKVPFKPDILRNGRRPGGTIGPKVEAKLGITAVDLGHQMQAMHSYREIMAWKDIISEVDLLKYIYENYEDLRTYVAV
jgi:aspartyl aminopeptidase